MANSWITQMTKINGATPPIKERRKQKFLTRWIDMKIIFSAKSVAPWRHLMCITAASAKDVCTRWIIIAHGPTTVSDTWPINHFSCSCFMSTAYVSEPASSCTTWPLKEISVIFHSSRLWRCSTAITSIWSNRLVQITTLIIIFPRKDSSQFIMTLWITRVLVCSQRVWTPPSIHLLSTAP